MKQYKRNIVWIIIILLSVWLLGLVISCSPIEDELIYPEPQRVQADAFPTLNGERSYIQHVYLDTLSSFTYTQIYAESTDMAENQKYNGEANIHARFSTNSYWTISLMVYSLVYPVYYTYPTAVRFIRSMPNNEYSPKTLALFTKQLVGPIPKGAVKINAQIKIYMDVSYDGVYHVKDSILLVLHAR
jgi:magnesium-transporting ATPase (P-type)